MWIDIKGLFKLSKSQIFLINLFNVNSSQFLLTFLKKLKIVFESSEFNLLKETWY
jgi:hypothetical protein